VTLRREDGSELTVPLDEIREATLVAEWGTPRKP
jgi:hypothetical protein